MNLVKRNSYNVLESLTINVLKCGPIPNHLAFIMDGNRRYAKANGVEIAAGHRSGWEKMAEALGWCKDFGIKEVSVFAFSIENFKRSKGELDALFSLADEKLRSILDENKQLEELGVCVRLFGKLEMLPENIRQKMSQLILATRYNDRLYLNVCMAYASRYEMGDVIDYCVDGVNKGLIEPGDIDDNLFESLLYTGLTGGPDMIIRTSGESRLSDFFLWQSATSLLEFPRVYWPAFSFFNLSLCILSYQRNITRLQKWKAEVQSRAKLISKRQKAFIDNIREQYYDNALRELGNTQNVGEQTKP